MISMIHINATALEEARFEMDDAASRPRSPRKRATCTKLSLGV